MRERVAPLLTSEVPSLTLAVWTSQKATHSIPPHMTSGNTNCLPADLFDDVLRMSLKVHRRTFCFPPHRPQAVLSHGPHITYSTGLVSAKHPPKWPNMNHLSRGQTVTVSPQMRSGGIRALSRWFCSPWPERYRSLSRGRNGSDISLQCWAQGRVT